MSRYFTSERGFSGGVPAVLLAGHNMDVTKTHVDSARHPGGRGTLGLVVLKERTSLANPPGGLLIFSGMGIIMTRQATAKAQNQKHRARISNRAHEALPQ